MKQLVIIGASGHGKVIADIAEKIGYEKIVFLDDNQEITECGEYPVVGNFHSVKEYSCDIIVAIGHTETRRKMQEELDKCGHTIATLIHPNAIVGEHVTIGKGTVIMAGAVVNPYSRIGNGCIINTNSCVDHECNLADYVHLSVGANLAGNVTVGERTWFGVGSSVGCNLSICEDCIIEAGTVVTENIIEPGSYLGVPARRKA